MSATLLFAALAVAQPLHVWEPVKFSPKPGTKLTYAMSAETAFEGMGQTFNTSIQSSQTFEAEEVVEGWTRVKMTVLEQKVQSDMPFGETPDPTGLTTSVLVSPTCKQKDFKVVSSGKMTSDQIAIMTSSSKKDLESGFEGLVLPEGDLAAGAAWVLEHSPAGAGMAGMPTTTNGKLKTSYKVLEVKDGNAVIEAKTAGTYDMNIETPDGAFSLKVTTDETKKFTVRASDGVILAAESQSNQTMASDFGEFTTKTKSKSELKKD